MLEFLHIGCTPTQFLYAREIPVTWVERTDINEKEGLKSSLRYLWWIKCGENKEEAWRLSVDSEYGWGIRGHSCSLESPLLLQFFPLTTRFCQLPQSFLSFQLWFFWLVQGGYGFLGPEGFSIKFYHQKHIFLLLGKTIMCSLSTQLSHIRMALEPGTLLPKRCRAHTAWAGLTPLCGNIFPCSGTMNTLLSPLAAYGTCPTPLFYLSLKGRRGRS